MGALRSMPLRYWVRMTTIYWVSMAANFVVNVVLPYLTLTITRTAGWRVLHQRSCISLTKYMLSMLSNDVLNVPVNQFKINIWSNEMKYFPRFSSFALLCLLFSKNWELKFMDHGTSGVQKDSDWLLPNFNQHIRKWLKKLPWRA